MNIKKIILLMLLSFIILLAVGCDSGNNYTIEVDIDNEEIISVEFEYKKDGLLKKGKNLIYVETTEQTHVIDRHYNKNVEFVRSDKSTLVKRDKIKRFMLGMGIRQRYITINLDDELFKEVTDLYAKELEMNLHALSESEFEF